jgi:hypothetical protein
MFVSLRVTLAHPRKLPGQGGMDGFRQNRHAIFCTLAISNYQYSTSELHILEPEAERFQ